MYLNVNICICDQSRSEKMRHSMRYFFVPLTSWTTMFHVESCQWRSLDKPRARFLKALKAILKGHFFCFCFCFFKCLYWLFVKGNGLLGHVGVIRLFLNDSLWTKSKTFHIMNYMNSCPSLGNMNGKYIITIALWFCGNICRHAHLETDIKLHWTCQKHLF